MKITCALCGSDQIEIREAVNPIELNARYRQDFGVEGGLNSSSLNYCVCSTCGLGFFNPMETGSEALYERLQAFDWYYMADKYEYSIAHKHLPPEGTVLEVGSGKAAFAAVVGAGRYTGLEFNDKAIERASQAGIRLIKQPVEAYAILGDTYDAVVSFQVLEHVADPAGFIRSCVKCLKPGGRLIVAVPAHDGFVGNALNNILDMPPHHVTHWTGATLRYLAAPFGLEVLAIEYEPVAEYHRAWACKTIWESRLRRWLGVQYKLLDYSLTARLLSRLSSIFGNLFPVPLGNVKGHTVIGIYRKI
jgi:SAM-dependent methyltransferase